MTNFTIQFAYPWSGWLLFLLIPAIAVPLFLHFRLAKRYRRTRNRIISLVLHLTVMVLAISALSGMIFSFRVENPENEIILLVDVSDTEEESAERRDEFVRRTIDDCGEDGIRTGIVTFGFDQRLAVPLSRNTDGMFERYLGAELPDTSATDIAAALNYASTLFTDTQASKIVLITDGKETDERAASVIGAIAAQGIWVDAVYVPSDYDEDAVQIVGITLPDYHVSAGEECVIGVTVRSKTAADEVKVELFDNGVCDEENGTQIDSVTEGGKTFNFRYTFAEDGLHELKARISRTGDNFEENDEYFSYVYLEVFDNVLVLERYEGQSEELETLLTENGAKYRVDVKNIAIDDDIPSDIETLRKYDQVILNNISNADLQLHKGLDSLLYSYAYEYGGGVFTVGGGEEDGDEGAAHAYNREDMAGSLYQQMLPVQIIDYTPPVGVIFILDISSSMDSATGYGTSKREAAKEGMKDLVRNDVLSERDYVGIMTLDNVYGVVLPLTRFTRQDLIMNAIDGIDGLGGTVFSQAISRAGQLLTDEKNIERRHIVIITDGAPTGTDAESYLDAARQNYANGEITCSVLGIGLSEGSGDYQKMSQLVEEGHGELYLSAGRLSDVADKIREDLQVNALGEVVPEPFNPTVYKPLSNLFNGVEYGSGEERDKMDVELGGFYGVKVRSLDYLVLTGDYLVPLYAQWKFGKGSVGSFMCDLNGRWSSEFMHDPNGRQFLLNVIRNLMPTENIHPSGITCRLAEDNYFNTLSFDADLNAEEDEYVRGEIVPQEGGEAVSLNSPPEGEQNGSVYVTEYLSAESSSCRFIVKRSGTYRIILYKCAADGTVLDSTEVYKTFSFSEEYDLFAGEEQPPREALALLTERSEGHLIEEFEDRYLLLEDFETTLERTFDPRLLFMGLAMVLFLLDMVVRKFKFKWIHELIRDRRAAQGTRGKEGV